MENERSQYAGSDRSAMIILFSVAAIIILGPITGVPAWIMANQDLRDLRTGFIHPSALHSLSLGRVLAIIGTFFSPVWLLVIIAILFVVFMVVGEVAMTMMSI